MIPVLFTLLLTTLTSSVHSRSAYHNTIDLNDDFYSELRNLLREHLDKRAGTNVIHPQEVRNWPRGNLAVGYVAGVAVDAENRPTIFHRGSHIWDETTFNGTDHYQKVADGPISDDTVFTLDSHTGSVVGSWGKNLFYMPHGITIDKAGNVWLTDIALHQVFKFPPGASTPSLTLGVSMEPGDDDKHFCKPTDVAVTDSGAFFVADGYCNSRILQYSADGTLVVKFGEEGLFNVPHSLALFEEQDLLCVADRENERIACFNAGITNPSEVGMPAGTIRDETLGRVFAIAPHVNHLFAVSGASFFHESTVQGLTIDISSGSVVDTWSPTMGFESPHDIAVSPDGTAIYVVELGPNKIWKFLLEADNVESYQRK